MRQWRSFTYRCTSCWMAQAHKATTCTACGSDMIAIRRRRSRWNWETLQKKFFAIEDDDSTAEGLKRIWPALRKHAECPVPGCADNHMSTVESVIIHLNDHHHWTREEIADWLDALEAKGKLNLDAKGVKIDADGNISRAPGADSGS